MLAPRSHPQLLHADDAILVVVDMQEPFLRGVWERERVVSSVALLVQAATTLRVPIVPTPRWMPASVANRSGGNLRA